MINLIQFVENARLKIMDYIEEEISRKIDVNKNIIVGYADVREITGGVFNSAICIAGALPRQILEYIRNNRVHAYGNEIRALRNRGQLIENEIKELLNEFGYVVCCNNTEKFPEIPYKTIAVLSGLGWIGKNNLIVTKRFGSACRLKVIYTDAVLTTKNKIIKPLCGKCRKCVDACPVNALNGVIWSKHTELHKMLDKQLCHMQCRKYSEENGEYKLKICGKCFVACPYTLKYENDEGCY